MGVNARFISHEFKEIVFPQDRTVLVHMSREECQTFSQSTKLMGMAYLSQNLALFFYLKACDHYMLALHKSTLSDPLKTHNFLHLCVILYVDALKKIGLIFSFFTGWPVRSIIYEITYKNGMNQPKAFKMYILCKNIFHLT